MCCAGAPSAMLAATDAADLRSWLVIPNLSEGGNPVESRYDISAEAVEFGAVEILCRQVRQWECGQVAPPGLDPGGL